MKYVFIAILMLTGSLFTVQAKTDLEFGSSVTFPKGTPEFSLADAKGKTVFIVFFQSWCGICNKWAPQAIKSLQDKHADKNDLILIALKTDGGSPDAAVSFLEAKGCDTDRWLIGSDAQAKFYKKFIGKAPLWGTVLIGGDGEIVEKSMLGMFQKIRGKQVFSVGKDDFLKKCPATKPSMSTKASGRLQGAITFAELGCFPESFKMCKNEKIDKAQAAKISNELGLLLEKELKLAVSSLQDKEGSAWDKYKITKKIQSWKYLKSPSLKNAVSLANKVKNSTAVRNEAQAEVQYNKLFKKFDPNRKTSVAKVKKGLAAIAKRYKLTYYGQIAEEGLDL